MERCQNCGAPARAGAKFCTTCGSRLPQRAEGTAPIAAETNGGLGAKNGDGVESRDVASAESPIPGELVDERAAPADELVATSWPSAPTSPWPTTRSQDDFSLTRTTAPMVVVNEDAPADSLLSASVPFPTPAVDPSGVYPVIEIPTAPWEVIAEQAAIGAASHPLTRAIGLIDELRTLLPALTTTTPIADATLVADDLAAAIRTDSQQSVALADLRAALLSARDRPRDIDTVLDLSRRIDAIVILLDDHDRAVEAINRAIGALRGAPAERS